MPESQNCQIISEIRNYKNRSARTIFSFFDHPKELSPFFIIIPPAFGETKRDSLKLSYYLVKNGFNCLRYDASCHVGESQGDMLYASLSKMCQDLFSAIDFLENNFDVNSVAVAGTSLAVRIAMKAAGNDNRIKFLLGLVGIVDLRSTLKAVYHQDVIGEIMQGSYKGKFIDDIMGFEVSIDFALDAIKEGYHNLETSIQDMHKLDIPVVFIAAENDPWVKLEDARKALNGLLGREKDFVVIPNAMHVLNENPAAADLALSQAVASCKKYFSDQEWKLDDVVKPGEQELSRQWLIEEARLRNLIKKSLEGEKEFWEKYLNKFVLIYKSSDYRSFLSDINGLLDVGKAETVLDAGCGNGHFGAWLFERVIEDIFKEEIDLKDFPAVSYIGLDFVEKSLKDARLKHLNLVRRVYRELSLRDKYQVINFRYVLSNIEKPLPFPDNYFDKICCNLVISYVKDPQFSVKELIRVLKPGGKMVVSSMKPFADLSQIYRNFADQTENQEELEEARKLLSAAGRIKQKEGAGIYKFFSEEELLELLGDGGELSSVRTFADQVNAAIFRK
jgi:ubiquinone/menaquinone biosynthesis C-methylase UbiE/esterase/lipase